MSTQRSSIPATQRGLRMIERGAFGDPRDARTALLVECGQHWKRAAAEVALDTLLRFLGRSGVLAQDFVAPQLQRIGHTPPARQQLVRVTEAVVANTPFAPPATTPCWSCLGQRT